MIGVRPKRNHRCEIMIFSQEHNVHLGYVYDIILLMSQFANITRGKYDDKRAT